MTSAGKYARARHFVIVDVLSFSTCVDVATERGAHIIPYFWKDSRAESYARARQALLAGGVGSTYALTVESLSRIPAGTRLVLPSPNGSTLSFGAAQYARVLAGFNAFENRPRCARQNSSACGCPGRAREK